MSLLGRLIGGWLLVLSLLEARRFAHMRMVIHVAKPSIRSKTLRISTGICRDDFFGSSGTISSAKAGHLAVLIGYVQSCRVYPTGFMVAAVLWSTGVQSCRIVPVFIHVGVAIKLVCVEIQREPRARCTCQWHFAIRVPHRPAFMLGPMLFAEYVPSICRRHNLHIRKTQRPVVVSTTIKTTPLFVIGCEYLLQLMAAELPCRLHCTVELFRRCVAEVGFTMCGHPHLQLAISINAVLCSTRGLVVIAQEQCYEIDCLRSGLTVVLFVSVREASALRF